MQEGILQSLAKRSYTQDRFDRMISNIERDVQKQKKREITSAELGDIVMKNLKKFDKIAYIRFASIYRSFEDVDTFQSEINSLQKKKYARKK